MSAVDADLDAAGPALAADGLEVTAAREARVGSMNVSRLLPLRSRRSVGAWCFIDHYGPMSVDGVTGMKVPPHPHIGLQTVTWLLAGNVLHRDSLGSQQMIRPGQLNLMTSGRGIAHSEESQDERDPLLHGVQLWVALPESSRHTAPDFEHHAELPVTGAGGLDVTVLLGSLAGATSTATTFSEIVGAQLVARDDIEGTELTLTPSFEHALFLAAGGSAAVHASDAHMELRPGQLLYLAPGRQQVRLTAAAGTVMMLLGGIPLGERLLMWWNFVARTPQEIEAAVAEWRDGQFGEVSGYAGEPLAAPPLDITRLIRPR